MHSGREGMYFSIGIWVHEKGYGQRYTSTGGMYSGSRMGHRRDYICVSGRDMYCGRVIGQRREVF